MIEFESTTPILNVRNFAASMEYYVSKLGELARRILLRG